MLNKHKTEMHIPELNKFKSIIADVTDLREKANEINRVISEKRNIIRLEREKLNEILLEIERLNSRECDEQ